MAFSARKTTLHALLGKSANAQIRVPDYQRGYSWEKKQFMTFLRDLTQFHEVGEEDREYFLGPIVLMKMNQLDDHYFLVDGQQRIATSLILLSSIRDLAASLPSDGDAGLRLADDIQAFQMDSEGPEGGLRPSLRLGDLDQRFFEQFIIKRDRDADVIPRNGSNGLIKQARNGFDEYLRLRVEQRTDSIEYLRSLYRTVVRRVAMVAIDVDTDREAMNVFERINARGKPLTEADLIRHRLMSSSTKDERSKIRRHWDSLENQLNGEAQVSKFLAHMWTSRFGPTGPSKLYDLVSDYLSKADTSCLDFAKTCDDDCFNYLAILKGDKKELPAGAIAAMRATQATLRTKSALPLFLAARRVLGKSPSLTHLAQVTEAVVVRHRYLARRRGAELDGALANAALALGSSRGKSALGAALAVLHAANPPDDEVIAGVDGKMKLGPIEATYLLREIENHHSQVDGAFKSHATLEHVFPRRATAEEWPKREILAPYLWHLGNLALLTSKDNSKAGNRRFPYKKAHIYEGAQLPLTRAISDVRMWGVDPIRRRARSLAELAAKRWTFACSEPVPEI